MLVYNTHKIDNEYLHLKYTRFVVKKLDFFKGIDYILTGIPKIFNYIIVEQYSNDIPF